MLCGFGVPDVLEFLWGRAPSNYKKRCEVAPTMSTVKCHARYWKVSVPHHSPPFRRALDPIDLEVMADCLESPSRSDDEFGRS